MEIKIQTQYALSELIDFAYYEKVDEVWDSQLDGMAIFTSSNQTELKPETPVYLDYINPELYKDNVEGYSSFVIRNNLDILCLGEIFLDVIDFYKTQKSNLDYNLVIRSLTYYLEKDDFLELKI